MMMFLRTATLKVDAVFFFGNGNIVGWLYFLRVHIFLVVCGAQFPLFGHPPFGGHAVSKSSLACFPQWQVMIWTDSEHSWNTGFSAGQRRAKCIFPTNVHACA